MKRFFLGRLPILLGIACAAEMGLESGRYAAASATSAVQIGDSWDAPAVQITGWFTSDDRSWVAALAPDVVTQ